MYLYPIVKPLRRLTAVSDFPAKIRKAKSIVSSALSSSSPTATTAPAERKIRHFFLPKRIPSTMNSCGGTVLVSSASFGSRSPWTRAATATMRDLTLGFYIPPRIASMVNAFTVHHPPPALAVLNIDLSFTDGYVSCEYSFFSNI
ncbi:hypothetical protein ACLOJK_016988 [Asimina triloba]